MKAAAYFRVSTNHQEFAAQRNEVLAYCAARSWPIVAEFREKKTGTVARPELSRLIGEVEKRRFDVVVFWSLDCLSREGPLKTMVYLDRLARAGVKFHSFSEPFLDSVSGVGELLVPIIAWIAKQEAIRRGERVRAGVENAKRNGTKTGRPFGRAVRRISAGRLQRIALERRQGISWERSQDPGHDAKKGYRRAAKKDLKVKSNRTC